jgi:biopolymer transport protein ExbB/TolQ
MLIDLFKHAGVVAWPLGAASILALGIILERFYTLSRLARIEKVAAATLATAAPLPGSHRDPAIADAPISRVANALENVRGAHPDMVTQTAEIALGMQRLRLRKYLGTLATIGSTSPFVGLFGTVLGVIAAFEEMSHSQLTGEKMSKGISEALSATALGLLVAIPAVVAYNFMVGKVNGFLLQVHADTARILPQYTSSTEAAVAVDGNHTGKSSSVVLQKQEG